MALKPKTELLQIRIDPELNVDLKAWADYEDRPVSDMVRRLLVRHIEQFREHLARKSLKLVDGVLVEVPPQDTSLHLTNAHVPNRQQRRAQERDDRKGR